MTARTDAPRGFTPVNRGSGYMGTMRAYSVDTTSGDVFVGDPVVLTGRGKNGKGVVDAAGTNGDVLGVVVGVEVDLDVAATEHPGYVPSANNGVVYVVHADPEQYFIAQEDGKMAISDIGQACVAVAGSGDTNTGRSAYELDSSKASTGTNHPWLVVGLDDRPDNGTGTNADWLVVCQTPQLRAGTSSTGAV